MEPLLIYIFITGAYHYYKVTSGTWWSRFMHIHKLVKTKTKKPLPNFSFTKALCGVQLLDSWSSPYACKFDCFSASKLMCHKGSVHDTNIFNIFTIFPSLYLTSHMQNIYPGGGQADCLSCFPRTAPVKGSTARKCGN